MCSSFSFFLEIWFKFFLIGKGVWEWRFCVTFVKTYTKLEKAANDLTLAK